MGLSKVEDTDANPCPSSSFQDNQEHNLQVTHLLLCCLKAKLIELMQNTKLGLILSYE